jgi:uncharacterized protein YndB with AHSA1/START domain
MMFTPFYIVLTLGVLLIAAFLAILLIAAFKPNHFRVQRSLDINAPAEKIFAVLNNLKQQRHWSPWDQKDPHMKRTYTGAESGVGAKYAWDGNKQIGAGSQQIMATKPNERIDINIDFTRPFEAHNKIEFILRPSGGGTNTTNVTWAIHGPMPFMFRAMSVLCTMDKMMSKEFDKGLTQLKALVEK